MTQLVLFNGPPGCGKDTVVRELTPYLKFTHLKFASPIKRMACGLLNCDMRWLEANKDTCIMPFKRPHSAAGEIPVTVRRFLIDLSETFMKQCYGQDVFGNILWTEAKNAANKLVLVSDCGFRSEVDRVVHSAGRANCLVVRIHRHRHTFSGDSRSYLNDTYCDSVDIYNDRDPHWLTMQALRVIMKKFKVEFLKEPEWLRGI